MLKTFLEQSTTNKSNKINKINKYNKINWEKKNLNYFIMV